MGVTEPNGALLTAAFESQGSSPRRFITGERFMRALALAEQQQTSHNASQAQTTPFKARGLFADSPNLSPDQLAGALHLLATARQGK